MAGRRLSGIWVPVQLDTSRIDADLTKVNKNIGASLETLQKNFEGALNTRNLSNAFVGVTKNIGSIKDAMSALSKSNAFDNLGEGFEDMARAAGVPVARLKELYQEMTKTQAVDQQVTALTSLQRSFGLTGKAAIDLGKEMGVSEAALSKFATKNIPAEIPNRLKEISTEGTRAAEAYRKLADASKIQPSQAGFEKFIDAREVEAQVAAFKKLNDTSQLTQAQLHKLASDAGLSAAQMRMLGLSVSDTGQYMQKGLKELNTSATTIAKMQGSTKAAAQGFTELSAAVQKYQIEQGRVAKVSNIVSQTDFTVKELKKYSAQLKLTEADIKAYVAAQNKQSSGRGVAGILTPHSMSAGIQSGAAAVGVSFGMYGIAELAVSANRTALQLENLQIALESVYKDGMKADASMMFLKETSDKLGLSLLDTSASAKKVFAAAQGTSVSDEIYKIYDAFSTMGSALRLSSTEMDSVMLALSQSISKGKISAEELRGQMAERLPGAVNILADAMGISTAKLDKMFEAGTVGLENWVLMADEIEKRYSEGAMKGATGLQAEINRLNDQWGYLKASFTDTEAMADAARAITDVVKALKDVAPVIITVGKQLLILGTSIGAAVLAIKAIGVALPILKTMGAYLAVATTSMSGLSLAASSGGAALAALINPATLVVAAIAAIGVAWANWDTTPILDAAEGVNKLRAEAVLAKESVRNLNLEMLGKERTSTHNAMKTALDDLIAIKAEADEVFTSLLALNSALDTNAMGFMGSSLVMDLDPKASTKLIEDAKKLATKIQSDLSIPMDIEVRKESLRGAILDIQNLKQELLDAGHSADVVEKVADALTLIADKSNEVGKTSSKLAEISNRFNELNGIKVDLNVKDINNAAKAIDEFTKNSDVSEFQALNLAWEGQIQNILILERELAKLPKTYDEGSQEAKMAAQLNEQLAEKLSKLNSQASESPTSWAAFINALDASQGKLAEMGLTVDMVRQKISDMSTMQLELDVQNLEQKVFQDALKKSLPKNVQAAAPSLTKLAQGSGESYDQQVKDAKALSEAMKLGTPIDEAMSKLKSFSHLTKEQSQLVTKLFNTAKEGYVETSKGTSSTSKGISTMSAGMKEYNKLVEKTQQIEAKLNESKEESFTASSDKYVKEIQSKLLSKNLTQEENRLITEQLALYQQQADAYKVFLADKQALEEEEKNREDQKDRGAFYLDLAEKVGDSNMAMKYFNESLAEQIARWQELKIPQEYIDQMAYLQNLEIRTDFIAGIERGFNSLKRDAQDFASVTENAFNSMTSSMANAFAQFITTGEINWSSFVSTLLADMATIAAKAAMNGILSGIFGAIGGMFGGFLGGGASTVGSMSFMGPVGTRVFHGGGIAGEGSGPSRMVSPSVFSGAPKFHSGGIVGPNEVPAILERGEGIFTRAQMANLAPVGSQSGQTPIIVNQTFNIEYGTSGTDTSGADTGGVPQDFMDKVMTDMRTGVKQIVRQEMINESRAGGLMRRG